MIQLTQLMKLFNSEFLFLKSHKKKLVRILFIYFFLHPNERSGITGVSPPMAISPHSVKNQFVRVWVLFPTVFSCPQPPSPPTQKKIYFNKFFSLIFIFVCTYDVHAAFLVVSPLITVQCLLLTSITSSFGKQELKTNKTWQVINVS